MTKQPEFAEGGAPAFDPNQPSELVQPPSAPPAFDPSKPSEVVGPTAAPGLLETAGDFAKSTGVGLAKGVIGLAGLPADVSKLLHSGSNYLASKITGQEVKAAPSAVDYLGSENIRKTTEGVTGEFYKPETVYGRYAETAGEFAPALIGGAGSLLTKLLTRVAAPAAVGQTAEEAAKLVAPSAAPYAKVVGSLTGAVGATAASNALSRVSSSGANVAADLARAIKRDGETPESILVKLQEVQTTRPNATILDVGGENVRGLAERIAQTPGAGRTIITPAITGRQREQMGRLSTDLTTLTGNRRTATQAVEETMAARKSDASPYYDIAMDFNARRVPEIVDVWRRETAQGWGRQVLTSKDFKNTLQSEYGIKDATNAPLMVVIDAWKKQVDGLVSEAIRGGNNRRAEVLKNMKDRIVETVDRHNPAYAEARNAWAGPSQYLDAIADGRGILKQNSDEVAAKVAAMTDAQKEAYRIGAVSAYMAKMGRDPAKMADITKYLRSPEESAKIAAFMPTPAAAEDWVRRLAYEVSSSEITGRTLANSATARRLAEQKQAEGIVGDLVFDALSHGVSMKSLLMKTITAFPARMRDTLRSRADKELASVLVQPKSAGDAERALKAATTISEPRGTGLSGFVYSEPIVQDRHPVR